MAKLEVKPSTQTEFSTTDVNGRIFTIRKPEFLANFRLIDMLGESAKNETYMKMVGPLLYLGAIDGDAILFPETRRQLDALIKRVGEDGYVAVIQCVAENFAAPEGAEEAIKNDSGTPDTEAVAG